MHNLEDDDTTVNSGKTKGHVETLSDNDTNVKVDKVVCLQLINTAGAYNTASTILTLTLNVMVFPTHCGSFQSHDTSQNCGAG